MPRLIEAVFVNHAPGGERQLRDLRLANEDIVIDYGLPDQQALMRVNRHLTGQRVAGQAQTQLTGQLCLPGCKGTDVRGKPGAFTRALGSRARAEACVCSASA